ncbi:MAG: DoxX family protein [Deltaproteobacteria bacterium]
MCKSLLRTKNDISALILRLMLGIVFFPHGAQKVLGWFGGYGFKATLASFTDKMHIPLIFALLAIIAEFFGSIALVFGFLTRLAAFGIAAEMVVAVFMVHGRYGFFMNWSGMQKGNGIEYHLLVIAIALALMIKGGGSFSVDKNISKS